MCGLKKAFVHQGKCRHGSKNSVPYFFDQTLQLPFFLLFALFALVQQLLQVDVCSFVDVAC